ncbi:MAG: VOC family protein [Halobacteriales archaeon]|nr:VOC family protein [Halobacteriales archaeon]
MPASTSVFLNVRDIGKSIEFYCALGFRVDAEHPGEGGKLAYADLSYQGAELGLGSIASNDDREYRSWVSTPLGAGVILTFSVPDVEEVHARAGAMRATIEAPLGDRSYGRAFNLNDPDGYVVCFITEPKRGRARKPAKAAHPKARRARKGTQPRRRR